MPRPVTLFTGQFADLLRCLATGTDPRPSFEDGLAVQRVLAAMEQSAADGSRCVDLGADDLAAPVPVTA